MILSYYFEISIEEENKLFMNNLPSLLFKLPNDIDINDDNNINIMKNNTNVIKNNNILILKCKFKMFNQDLEIIKNWIINNFNNIINKEKYLTKNNIINIISRLKINCLKINEFKNHLNKLLWISDNYYYISKFINYIFGNKDNLNKMMNYHY